MALGEMHAGLSRTVDDFMFVKVGTGVGCGIVVDGAVYRGQSGSAGGIGHIRVADDGPVCVCGNVGCLEAETLRPGWGYPRPSRSAPTRLAVASR
jgi:predicted NBD/HSP70 family sugar kinase